MHPSSPPGVTFSLGYNALCTCSDGKGGPFLLVATLGTGIMEEGYPKKTTFYGKPLGSRSTMLYAIVILCFASVFKCTRKKVLQMYIYPNER